MTNNIQLCVSGEIPPLKRSKTLYTAPNLGDLNDLRAELRFAEIKFNSATVSYQNNNNDNINCCCQFCNTQL